MPNDVNAQSTPTSAPLLAFQIEDLWPILRKQRNVVLLFLFTVLSTTLIGGLLKTPEYRATAIIQLSPQVGQEIEVREVVDNNANGYFELQQFYRTQIQILLSRAIREEVVRRYAEAGYDDLTPDNGGVDRLYAMMTVVPEEQSQLIDLSVVHIDPERASILANLVADVYSDHTLSARRDASAGAREWLDKQLQDYQTKVSEATRKVHDFKARESMIGVEGETNTLATQLASLNEAYGRKTAERIVAETSLSSQEALFKRGLYGDLTKVMSSATLDAASQKLNEVEARYARLNAVQGPQHPDVVQAKAEREAFAKAVQTELKRLIETERSVVAAIREAETKLGSEIDRVKQALIDQQTQMGDFALLQNDLDRATAFYDKLAERFEEVSVTAETQLNNVRIVDRALAPLTPWKPNIPLSLAVAAVVGIVGGIALALLREYVDDTITSQLDVIAHLKVPFIGLIPRLPEGVHSTEADLFTHFNPRSSVAEAVRGLRAVLEMNPHGPSPRRILVTSSVAREGKTSTTLRLGVSFAQMGKRVVILDADLRRPRLHKVFGADNRVGLSSYLVGVAGVSELPQATEVPNLYCIYSGESSDHPAELMGSPRMAQVLTELEEHFDIILLDTPPSVALSDAVTLSRVVDGIVLVVKEQAVSRAVVKQTLDLMRQVEAKIFGVILNNVDLQRGGSKYKYYYAYRDYYAYYGPDPAAGAPGESSGS